ncbi:MAG TPA: hypothetical protein VK449_08600 [Anaerolineales bacterium]|nr:hypothetical protein [Anaerolineales bacterium]
MALLLSSLDLLVSLTFTIVIAAQWLARRRMHALLWTWAMFVWTVAVAAETAAALNGAWTPTTYRLYYAFGALMVASWLGAGSLHLVAGRGLARGFTWVVALLSVVGCLLIFTYPIDPAKLSVVNSLGFVDNEIVKVFPLPVRIIVAVSNMLGSVAFIGAALYSLWAFRRHAAPQNRVIGVGMIAVGGLLAAGAHSLGALGGPGLFRISELATVVLIFAGYLLSTRRAPAPVPAPAPA